MWAKGGGEKVYSERDQRGDRESQRKTPSNPDNHLESTILMSHLIGGPVPPPHTPQREAGHSGQESHLGKETHCRSLTVTADGT